MSTRSRKVLLSNFFMLTSLFKMYLVIQNSLIIHLCCYYLCRNFLILFCSFLIRYNYVHNKRAAVTLHLNLPSNNKLELSRLSWANMTWCEAHVMNERHAPDDRHAHRDLILRMESAPHLSMSE